jgi:hypothetical protein
MSEPIHSEVWTGELTYGAGQTSVSTDYQRLMQIEQDARRRLDPKVSRIKQLAVIAVLSPLAIWIARWAAGLWIGDAFAQDYSGPLALWTFVVVAFAFSQFISDSRRAIGARLAFLVTVIFLTVVGAGIYGFAAVASHANAIATAPERTFEIHRCRGRCRMGSYFVHQRANGTTLEGEYVGEPLAEGLTCTRAQRLIGRFGFSWVRVIERSQPPEHQLFWPISREDCFGNGPVHTLKG